MGLASYGKPVYLKEFSDILKFDKKNYFRLNLKYFKHHTDKNFKYSFGDGVPKFNDLFSDHFVKIFGKPRQIDGEIEQKHMDIASSMQKHFEDVIIKILNNLYDSKKNENLCLAGGCAFNSKLNGLIKEKLILKISSFNLMQEMVVVQLEQLFIWILFTVINLKIRIKYT